MSFSFGFSGDDIDDEGGIHDQDTLVGDISKYSIADANHEESHTIEPRRHSLTELLASLPSQISYNTLTIPAPTPPTALADSEYEHAPSSTSIHTQSDSIQVMRRSLFDIRAQLMAEADPETHDDEADTMLAGLENGDLTSGIYEGGFKTWECALDLASLVGTQLVDLDANQDWQVIELGAGSAIPSLALLRAFLTRTGRQSRDGNSTAGDAQQLAHFKFTLCDYNEEVLRLCTAPNVLLNYHYHNLPSEHDASRSGFRPDGPGPEEEGELDVEDLGGAEAFVSETLQDMHARRLSFAFLSGGWGESFLDLIPSPKPERPTNLLILASETIYSPSSSKIFVDNLLRLLRRHRRGTAKAWVAAKKVYFGVGGGVDEFVADIEHRGGRSKILLETKDTGVGRVVMEVTI
ncbi:hypothetical protein A1O3_03922 [Capronia epimyces CBS 606.96]|uniref:protein-histidine N-methyltransferase n=1 Tax=Capronia epimyces CBS 606.96 TaxID=1182542 RepID=W9Y3A5_9EURO|nr:uncharacterized protein A1O3_03922 [Capronia epimyces CBS 606.96]EXJ86968.1 hypothetical protein A1O3_03922 [Capronia epimyces CBS 606.96]